MGTESDDLICGRLAVVPDEDMMYAIDSRSMKDVRKVSDFLKSVLGESEDG